MTDTKQAIKESSQCLEIHPKHMVDITEDNHTPPQVFWRTVHLIVVFIMLIWLPARLESLQESNCLSFPLSFYHVQRQLKMEVDFQLTESARASSYLI